MLEPFEQRRNEADSQQKKCAEIRRKPSRFYTFVTPLFFFGRSVFE